MMAGGMTKSNKIGMVGGFPHPRSQPADERLHGRCQGNQPQGRVHVSFINSWFDPPKAKEAAFAMIDKGADVMYAERFGVSDAAKEKGKLAIGNVINTQDKYPDTVVASRCGTWSPPSTAPSSWSRKASSPPKTTAPIDDEAQGLLTGPLGTFEKKVPADIVAKVKAKEKDILDGKFTVKVDDGQPKSTAK
jgi:basic membrane protein A